MYGRLYVAKGFGEKAIEHYEKLLEQNSCNYDTYYKILAAKHIKLFDAKGKPIKLQGSDYETVKNTMAYYQKGFPRVDAPTRIALKWLQGDDFAKSLKTFVTPLLIKGAPSVINDLKEFYTDDNKVQIIESYLLSNIASMETNNTLEGGEQDPTVLLWLYYFAANHYLYLKDNTNALVYINKGIEHTPTLIDLYTLKGKIMQQAGNRTEAAKLFEEARCLDTQDRALNAIAACYQVKAGNIQAGEDTIGIFFKDCGYESTVHDNQCLWFEQVCGKYLLQQHEYQKSLKEYSYSAYHV